ncbi:MAG: transposase family protein [Blastocatellales bacterium]
MSRDVYRMQQVFSTVSDFRHPRGRRYSLEAILMLTGLAMMNGAQSEKEVIDWTRSEGRRWLDQIGIRRRRGPSLATLHRVFRGIDRGQLNCALEKLNGESAALSACELTPGHNVPQADKQNFDLMLETLAAENGRAEQHPGGAGLKIWGVDLDRDTREWRAL